jgi:hypothetical protein
MLETHLRGVDARAYCALSGKGAKQVRPRYMLGPPLDHEEHYADGHEFPLEFSLFGEEAMGHARACVEAIAMTGRQGIGSSGRRGHFDLAGIKRVSPSGISDWDGRDPLAGAFTAADVARDFWVREAQSVGLRFVTPLRMKKDEGYERYSTGQRSGMRFGGLLGRADYRGEITPFLPYLAQLEYFNLGKETTFGHGKCVLSFA